MHCADPARGGNQNGVGGRGLGGRAGGPEDGFSRPQASGRPPGLFKRRPPSPPRMELAGVERVAHCAREWAGGVVVTCTVPVPRAGEIKMGWAAGDWVGAPEDRRPAFHGCRLRRGHPAFLKDGRRPHSQMELAGVERVAHCAREWSAWVVVTCTVPIPRAGEIKMGWAAGDWVGAPEDRRTAFHGRRPSPSNGRAGVESGWASWRTGGQLFTAAGSRTDTPALQDGGSVGEEAERREGGSRLRSAPRGVKLRGGKLKGPRWLYRRWGEYAPARSCIGGARRLAGPLHQMGGRVWNRGGRPGGPEASCSRPQAPGRTPRPYRMEAPSAKRLSAERAGAGCGAPRAESSCGAES